MTDNLVARLQAWKESVILPRWVIDDVKDIVQARAILEAKLEAMEMETLEICDWFELKTGHERAGWMPRKAAHLGEGLER